MQHQKGKENVGRKKILCEDCICSAICINQISFQRDVSYTYGVSLIYNGIETRCDKFRWWTRDIMNPDFQKMKRFFLIKKGFIDAKSL